MADILDIIGSLVDDRVGIIRQVEALRKDAGAPNFVYMSAQTCNLKMLNLHQHLAGFVGTGVATDRARATAKAAGEAVERYCAANYAIEDFRLATFESAPFPCIEPEAFALFSATQYAQAGFPYAPFTRKTPVRWVPALDLATGDTKYVPAAMVFLAYDEQDWDDTPITQQISTGLACHSDPTQAALAAVCEVIERDATAITWLAKLPRLQLRLDTLSARNRQLVARFTQQSGVSVKLLHLPMDHGAPVILSVITSTVPEAPALVFAAGAHLDPEQAVRKSLEELAQIWAFSQSVKSQRPKFTPGRRWANVVNMESHNILYFDPANLHLAEFLWKSGEQIAFNDIKNLSVQDPVRDLRLLVEKITAVKHRVLLVDVTSEDVRSLGLWVFRAVLPGFHPLFMGHRFRALGGARLWEVPQKLGVPGPVNERHINPAPHPL